MKYVFVFGRSVTIRELEVLVSLYVEILLSSEGDTSKTSIYKSVDEKRCNGKYMNIPSIKLPTYEFRLRVEATSVKKWRIYKIKGVGGLEKEYNQGFYLLCK